MAGGEEIAAGLVSSATVGVGQFCTKPGLVFVPADSSIASLVAEMIRTAGPGAMLSASMRESFTDGVRARSALVGVGIVESREPIPSVGAWVSPRVAVTSLAVYVANVEVMSEECFGPLTVLVEYQTASDLREAALLTPGCLTATIHGQLDDKDDVLLCESLVTVLQDKAGRLIWNGWPTGVAVAWGMQHGGPYPASTSPATTSVGATAIHRFLRPVSYQDFPSELTPEHLRDGGLAGTIRRNGKTEIHK